MTEDGYIQGAGDDSEGWSNGLTPTLFWKYRQQLLAVVEEDMPDLIQGLISLDQNRSIPGSDAVKLGPTSLYIGTSLNAAHAEQYDGIIICGGIASSQPDQEIERHKERRSLQLQCGDGKLGSRALRSQLPRILPFITSLPDSSSPPKLLFLCSTGKDLSVGVALAVLCLFHDDDCKSLFDSLVHSSHLLSLANVRRSVPIDHFGCHKSSATIDKALIRRRLATITTAKPDANPSRSTLQSVHSFLMPRVDP